MWFFQWFQQQFWNLRNNFNDLGGRFSGLPWPVSTVAYPFYWCANALWNLSTAAQYASYWSDQIASTANAAYSNALNAYNYAYGYLSSAVQNALQTANSAWNYARNTVWNLANTALQRANEAYNYASGWLLSQVNSLLSTFWTQVNQINSRILDFVNQFWLQINAISTKLYEIHALIPSHLTIIDWVESSLGYLTTRAIALVTASASSFADPLWQCTDAIVGKLTEWKEK